MSGNQYVYVVELDDLRRSTVQLVTKNRKEAIAAYQTRVDRAKSQGYHIDDFFEIKRGDMWRYVKPGSRDVCIRMVRLQKDVPTTSLAVNHPVTASVTTVVRITAWVIKWAKEEPGQRPGRAGERSHS